MRNKIRATDLIEVDSLLKIYYTTFPENFLNSFEGKRIERILLPRLIRKGQNAPEFIVKDIYGNELSLDQSSKSVID